MAELTCHVCGYEMVDRAEGDLCPECGRAFEPGHEVPLPGLWLLRMRIGLLVLTALVMPFAALLSLILTLPTLFVTLPDQRRYGRGRVPDWVATRVRVERVLWKVLIAEFFLLMTIDAVWPRMFEWW